MSSKQRPASKRPVETSNKMVSPGETHGYKPNASARPPRRPSTPPPTPPSGSGGGSKKPSK